MAASLGELFIELGVFADTKELKQFEQKLKQISDKMKDTANKTENTNKSLKNFGKGLAALAGAIATAIYAVNRMTDSLVANNQVFLNLTRNSDIALSTFQEWDNVGRMFGVKNAAQQLANLNQRLYELKLTGEGGDGFLWAASQGVDIMNSTPEQILEQLREVVKGLDDTSATFLLNKMGLDPSMLHILRLTRKEFEAYNRETAKYRLTEEQAKNLQLMNAQLEAAKIKVEYLKDQALIAIMPYLIRVFEVIKDIGEQIKNVLDWLNNDTPLSNFIKGFLKLVTVLIACMTVASGLIKIFKVLGMVITAVRAAMVLLSANPIIAGLTLLAGALMWGISEYQKANGSTPINAIPNTQSTNQAIDQRNYSRTSTHNQQITMNNTIHTTEAAKAVQNDLYYYQNYAFGSGYAY